MKITLKILFNILFFLIFSFFTLLAASARGELAFEAVIEGLAPEPRKNCEMALSPPEGMIRDGHMDELLLTLFVKEAPEKIRQALEPFGYYHPRIDVSIEKFPERVRLSARIQPGAPVRVSRVEIQITGPGAGEETLLQQIRAFPLGLGYIPRLAGYY
ncbi:MAG: POTRA domain-containing protein [Thermodesulfobacteriota bacterium]